MVYCAGKLYFIKAIDHTFYGFTGVMTHLGCWENTRKACKSLAFSWGGSRIFFRRGFTRLLLYFNTNKPHSFFFFAEYQLY